MKILHNAHDKSSREFVAAYGHGHSIIDWYGDPAAQAAYLAGGHPHPSAFPSVLVDVQAYMTVEEILTDPAGKETTLPPRLVPAHEELFREPKDMAEVTAFIKIVKKRAKEHPPVADDGGDA